MRAKDELRRDTLRFVLAAVQREGVDRHQAAVDKLIAEGKPEDERATWLAAHKPGEIDDLGVADVIQKQAKMRRDSIEAFHKGGREELAILGDYMPKQLAEAEIRAIVRRVVAETGATGPHDMGKVMPKVLAETKDKADGKAVAALVQATLKDKAATSGGSPNQA